MDPPAPDQLNHLDRQLRRLSEIAPRHAQILMLRLLEQLGREQCAQFYGISVEAQDVLLLRAARDYLAVETIVDFHQEREEAAALAEALRSGKVPEGWQSVVSTLRGLQDEREQLKARQEQLEVRQAQSPRRRLDTWLRRAAILLILGLTAYFYFRSHRAPSPPSSPHRVR